MLEGYCMQMLTATALQMAHLLSQIVAYSFQQFGRYLTNKCFDVVNASIEAGLSVKT